MLAASRAAQGLLQSFYTRIILPFLFFHFFSLSLSQLRLQFHAQRLLIDEDSGIGVRPGKLFSFARPILFVQFLIDRLLKRNGFLVQAIYVCNLPDQVGCRVLYKVKSRVFCKFIFRCSGGRVRLAEWSLAVFVHHSRYELILTSDEFRVADWFYCRSTSFILKQIFFFLYSVAPLSVLSSLLSVLLIVLVPLSIIIPLSLVSVLILSPASTPIPPLALSPSSVSSLSPSVPSLISSVPVSLSPSVPQCRSEVCCFDHTRFRKCSLAELSVSAKSNFSDVVFDNFIKFHRFGFPLSRESSLERRTI